jgi:photosystem II stability/assembly factor-like uncharacterized protein
MMAAVANAGYIYMSVDNGVTWVQQTAGGLWNWRAIASSADGAKLVAGAPGYALSVSNNGGAAWTQVEV